MIEDLEKMANLSIPKDLAGEEARKYLADACTKFDIKCPPPQTTARLLDKVNSSSLNHTICDVSTFGLVVNFLSFALKVVNSFTEFWGLVLCVLLVV